jgi:hypothetical protein
VPPPEYIDELEALLDPASVLTRAEVLTRPCPAPAVSGVYGWHFDEAPPHVPTQGCHETAAGVLLYVGSSPKAPPKDGRPGSRQTLRSRIRYHFRGNAYGRPGVRAGLATYPWSTRRGAVRNWQERELRSRE